MGFFTKNKAVPSISIDKTVKPTKPVNPVNPNDINSEEKPEKSISSMIGSSKRLTLTYIVLTIWVGLAIFAIYKSADFYGLAVYFASGLPLILGYLWSETNRPSLKDASQILRFIRPPRNGGMYDNYGDMGGYNGGGYYNNYGGYGRNNKNDIDYNSNINNNINDNTQKIEISIYSDDSSVELKANENQLETLMNTGYVDSNGDKYTFNKNNLEQVKSLINDNIEEPEI